MSENAKDNAVQQAQTWAQEARTQRATVLEILRYFGLPERDWEALSLIKAKLGDVPPAAAPAVQTELTDERISALWNARFDGRPHAFARAIERDVRSLLSGTRTCVQAGDSQTQEIAHLAASQASRTSGDAATNAPSAAGSDSAAGVAVAPDNRISVDRGALQMALNVLCRAGKNEVADALAESADAGVMAVDELKEKKHG